jgi:glucokinase
LEKKMTQGELVAGVDVGGTKVAVLVADRGGNVRSRLTVPTRLDGGPEETVNGIAEAVEESVRLAGRRMGDVGAVGIGVPGRVDPTTGVVRSAVNLGWREMPVGEALSKRLGAPCTLENDVRAAALGVQRYFGKDAPRDMSYVAVGTGIAAGLILDGRVYRGAHGLAGEIGHMVVEPDGRNCACGGKGCLETVAAGPAIARMGQEAAKKHETSALRKYKLVTAQAVYQAAEEGDEVASELAHKVGAYLALALQQLIVAYDMEMIVLGGGVSRAGDAFLRPLIEELARLRHGSALESEMIQPEMIRLLPPEYDAGTWGAVVLAGG